LNKRLDALQAIENREAELEGREPVDVINEYKRQRAKEHEIIDVEVVSDESSESRDHIEERERTSHLPVPVPKIAATEQESKQSPKNLRRLSEEWWDAQPFDVQMTRCRADLVSGTGRCTNISVKGSRVCVSHGAKAPAVKAAARTRLEMAADHLVQRLLQMPDSDDIKAETRLRAIDSALDRIGLKAPTEVVLSPGQQHSTGFDEVFEGIYSGARTSPGQDDSIGLGIESNNQVENAGSFDYRPDTDTGTVAQQQDQNPTNATQYRNASERGTNSTAGTPRRPLSGADYQDVSGQRRSFNDSQSVYSELDERVEQYRQPGMPPGPNVVVAGEAAMRIAAEAQALSRRLAGLTQDDYNTEI
jgi:hypothetical protein